MACKSVVVMSRVASWVPMRAAGPSAFCPSEIAACLWLAGRRFYRYRGSHMSGYPLLPNAVKCAPCRQRDGLWDPTGLLVL
jgi:hypothetical protein